MSGNSMLREIVEGYARADLFIQRERRAALAGLTSEGAWAAFRALWRSWAQTGGTASDLDSLDALRIDRLIELRRRLDRLAANRG